MKYILILLLFISCNPRLGNKALYEAEVKIVKLDNTIDTVKVIYFDYIVLDLDHALKKKDGKEISKNVKNYKILKKKKINL
jgi:hypothetical protein